MIFSKILIYSDMSVMVPTLCVEFHDRQPNSLGGVESQKNHRSGHIRASLTQLNNDKSVLGITQQLFRAHASASVERIIVIT